MTYQSDEADAWRSLGSHAERMDAPENHLSFLMAKENRFAECTVTGGGILYDYSRQRVDRDVMASLIGLAKNRGLMQQFLDMTRGKTVNRSENRAALHTAARDFSGREITVNGVDVAAEVRRVREEMREFAHKVHSGSLTGTTGKRFEHVVVIGIGGSYLGTEFVAKALEGAADKGVSLHFLSNVDIDCFGAIARVIDPETTMWIVISKSYTTTETMANARQAETFIRRHNLEPKDHIATVTAKGSPGDDPDNPVLGAFHMFDFIGGRFSVTSAVGGVPLSLYVGYDRFERFLKGAEEMDGHATDADPEENAPLLAALISVWNNNFLGYAANAVIPYSTPLSKLPAHIQQLYMESNGKGVTGDGILLETQSGVIVFGEPGTNAQHSFFQLAHQGRPFPIDFIGVVNPHHGSYTQRSKGVTNHQELWANLIAQPRALAAGKAAPDDPARHFPGNRPSSTIVINDLSPENIGRLLSFYEAKTVFEAFVWDINPFDQFGVELGKTMAGEIRSSMARKNEDPDYRFDGVGEIERAYLDILSKGGV